MHVGDVLVLVLAVVALLLVLSAPERLRSLPGRRLLIGGFALLVAEHGLAVLQAVLALDFLIVIARLLGLAAIAMASYWAWRYLVVAERAR